MILDKIIFILHVAIFLVGILIPFIGTQVQLSIFSIVIPFLFFHWAVNDDTCALTLLESWATNTPKERTFVGRMISPIYNIPDDQIGKLVKALFFALWMVVQFRLGRLFPS